jgi:hypothetical protein
VSHFRTVLSIVVGLFAAASAAVAADAKVEGQEVGPVGQDVKYVVSPRGVHLGSVARKGSRMIVIVDGVAGPKFDEIVTPTSAYLDPRPFLEAQRAALMAGRLLPSLVPGPVIFSKDGKRFAYLGRQAQEWVLMVDGKELLRLPAEGPVSMILEFTGDDGKHLMFARAVFAGYELWVDGQKMPGTYVSGSGGSEGTTDPVISRDGTRYAYVAQIDRDRRTVIVDGKDAGYLGDNLQFTADGQHLFAFVRQDAIVGVVVDGKLKMKTDGISQLQMAPVGNGFAAVLQRLDPPGQFLLVNARKIEGSDCASISRVAFSPDGKHFAAICSLANNVNFVIVDGKKGQHYDAFWQPEALAFSPDSSRVGYVAMSAGKQFVVIDEDESDAFENNAKFLFSPDGKRMAYCGMRNTPTGQSWPVVIDGKAERLAPQVNFASFAFSPDGSRYAYLGGPRGGIYLDGKDTGLGGNFTFSPDSKHIVVVGHRATDNERGVFVDGHRVYGVENNYGVRHRAFTSDSQHLFWIALEPAAGPDAGPGDFEWVTYVDGKPAARCDRNQAFDLIYGSANNQFEETPPAWDVGPDGRLAFVGPVGEVVKRFEVTPPADTSIATMLANAVK